MIPPPGRPITRRGTEDERDDARVDDTYAAPLATASENKPVRSVCPDCGGGWTFDFQQRRVYCRTCEERR